MKVIILHSQSSFQAVFYNITKVSQHRAELMCAENFHALKIHKNIVPKDYIDYLLAKSVSNNTLKPQFHATLITNGREHNKWELTQIAHNWLSKMGYKKQPYLIFFHHDTKENHIHIVSTRIGGDGIKINDHYEGIRANQALNEVMGIDTKKQALLDINNAFTYQLRTRMDFILLLYAKKYALEIKGNHLHLARYGVQQATISLEEVYAKLTDKPIDNQRLEKLRDLFFQYRKLYSTGIERISRYINNKFSFSPFHYTSELTKKMLQQESIQIVFHSRNKKLPTDYSIIDHANKIIFNGKDIMALEELIRPVSLSNMTPIYRPEMDPQEDQSQDMINEQTQGLMIDNFLINIASDVDDKVFHRRRRKDNK